MSKYKIESGIPNNPGWDSHKCIYPFGDMKVGDSFLVAVEDKHRVRAAASKYGAFHNKKFSTRSVEGGIRIWRVS